MMKTADESRAMLALAGHDPADVWDAYRKETPAGQMSMQGALAFGFAAAGRAPDAKKPVTGAQGCQPGRATPGPWKISDVRSTEGEYLIVGGVGQDFGLIAAVPEKADAELIVALKARVDDRDRTIDLLEANARVQAKLLADTGRRVDELTRALKATREQLIKVRDASPEIRNHELETNQVIAQAWHTLNDTGVATPLEDRG